MEEGIFISDPAVAGTLGKHFVESRLHSDLDLAFKERVIDPLRVRYLDGNPSMGNYVAIDPATGEPLARLFGTIPARFLPFLQQALAARAK